MKAVRQPGEAAHPHPHGEILPLNVAGGYVPRFRVAAHDPGLGAQALGRGVALLRLGVRAVNLLEDRIVDLVRSEGVVDRFQVGRVTVGGELHPALEPAGNIGHKGDGALRVAVGDVPGGDQLGIGVDGGPGPHVSVAELALVLVGHVPGFGVAEGPYLVALDALAVQVAQYTVLVFGAGGPQVDEQLGHGVLGGTSYADSGADAHALDQAPDDLSSLLCRQPVHESSIHDRSRTSSQFDASCFPPYRLIP